jgi:hypothetical protein
VTATRIICEKPFRVIISPHRLPCALNDSVLRLHSATHKRRLGVVSGFKTAPCFCCATHLTRPLLFTSLKYRFLNARYINLSVLCPSPLVDHKDHSPNASTTWPPIITPDTASCYHCTAAMSVPEISPMEHHTSLEEMQLDKTAVQKKGGTYEDEREMSRMGKTQELRV